MNFKIISRRCLFIPVLLFSINSIAQDGQNQADTLRKGAAKIFIDCNSCDMNYTRQQIPYVNYVRDVREAQVYLLVTSQNSGSGGTQYTITFQGQGEFKGMNDTLVYSSNPDETSTITRERKTNLIKMGLMRYVAKTPVYSEIEIKHNADLEQEQVVDRWNNWVFELSTEPQFFSEEANKRLELRNSINISKITEEIKLQIEVDHFYNKERFIESVESKSGADSLVTSTFVTNEISMDNLFVRSLGDHWSAGFEWAVGSSSVENYQFSTEFLPAIEYDIYPYSEATHHQLRILYSAGLRFNNYIDSSVYNRTNERLLKQSLGIAFQVQKKWGSIFLSLEGSNYFHDFSKNRVELFTGINLRIFKGLSLQIEGGAAHINDQLNIAKGNVSEAKRLLKLTELATKYRLEGGIQLTYTFGSIYNNIVNPRFGNGNNYD
jgi:hypothetical protein